MDISERRAPQDGRFLVRIADRRIDLRVSTLPTQYGEKVVMRLLESEAPLKGFETLGFPTEVSTELKKMLELPQGMIGLTTLDEMQRVVPIERAMPTKCSSCHREL